MVLLNKFPDGFFEKTRPEAPKKKTDIIPIKCLYKINKKMMILCTDKQINFLELDN